VFLGRVWTNTRNAYWPWLRQLADQASQPGVTATPTIFVNGTQLDDTSPAGLIAAVGSLTTVQATGQLN